MNKEITEYGVNTIKKYKITRRFPFVGRTAKIIKVKYVTGGFVNIPRTAKNLLNVENKMAEQMTKYINQSPNDEDATKYKIFLKSRSLLSHLKNNRKYYKKGGITNVPRYNIDYNNIDRIKKKDLIKLLDKIRLFEIREEYLQENSSNNDERVAQSQNKAYNFVKRQ